MGMNDLFYVPRDPHPDEPDELTPDTDPIDPIERPHDDSDEGGAGGRLDSGEVEGESRAKDLDEPGEADRTPRP
jgi:hypothetical protein